MGRYLTPTEPLRRRPWALRNPQTASSSTVAKVDAQAGRFSIDQPRAYGVERRPDLDPGRECAMDQAFVGDLEEGAALFATQRIDQLQRSTDLNQCILILAIGSHHAEDREVMRTDGRLSLWAFCADPKIFRPTQDFSRLEKFPSSCANPRHPESTIAGRASMSLGNQAARETKRD